MTVEGSRLGFVCGNALMSPFWKMDWPAETMIAPPSD